MNKIFILISVLCSAFYSIGGISQTIYTWTEENGIHHYSNRATADAKKIDVIPPSYSFLPPDSEILSSSPPNETIYDSFSIQSPQEKEILHSSELEIFFKLAPNLKSGDSIQVFLDNQLVSKSEINPILLTPIKIGSHSLQLCLANPDGIILKKTEIINFSRQEDAE